MLNNEMPKLERFLAENTTTIVFTQLANLIGISKKMFTILLRNPDQLTVSQLKKIADITGLTIYQLIDSFIEETLIIVPDDKN